MITVNDIVKAVLNTYTEYISSLEGVLQIYLFGSHAYGSPHEMIAPANSGVRILLRAQIGFLESMPLLSE